MFELISLEPLLHKFTLRETGIDPEDFNAIKHTFDALPEDAYERKLRQIEFLKRRFPELQERLGSFLVEYYASDSALNSINDLLSKLSPAERKQFDSMPSSRRRSISKFVAEEHNSDHSIRLQRVRVGPFSQTYAHGNIPLNLPRVFEESSYELTEETGFRALLSILCKEAFAYTNARSMTIVIHQVTTSATKETPFVLPEGIHQDGADFIVSAIPIIMENVDVPASIVYDTEKVPIFTSHLMIGEGLFHDDKSYWHSVSDLHATADRGRRGTLGFDMRISQ
jgi:hypothetical protein